MHERNIYVISVIDRARDGRLTETDRPISPLAPARDN